MAGRRRTVGRRGANGSVRATTLTEQARRIRRTHDLRLAGAQDVIDELAVEMDRLRSAARKAARAELDPWPEVAEAVKVLRWAESAISAALRERRAS